MSFAELRQASEAAYGKTKRQLFAQNKNPSKNFVYC